MMSRDKEKYIAFANAREDLRIYNKPFWLDAVCGPDHWDAVVIEESGEIAAAVPYHKTKDRRGISYVLQPQLTQCFDIWTRPTAGMKQEKSLACQFRWIGQIAQKLLDIGADYYQMTFSSSLDNWAPFYWEGFHQQTRYSFLLRADMIMEDPFRGMNSTMKRCLRQVSGSVSLEELQDLDLFYHLQSNALSRQGIANPFSKDLVERVYQACRDHDCAKMLAVKDGGEIRSAGLYVFDRNFVYELLLGSSQGRRSSLSESVRKCRLPGAGFFQGPELSEGSQTVDVPMKKNKNYKALMTCEMIRFAGETGRGFDFEGSMVRSIAEHNRRFGAVMVPYHQIWKVNTDHPFRRAALQRLSERQL